MYTLKLNKHHLLLIKSLLDAAEVRYNTVILKTVFMIIISM